MEDPFSFPDPWSDMPDPDGDGPVALAMKDLQEAMRAGKASIAAGQNDMARAFAAGRLGKQNDGIDKTAYTTSFQSAPSPPPAKSGEVKSPPHDRVRFDNQGNLMKPEDPKRRDQKGDRTSKEEEMRPSSGDQKPHIRTDNGAHQNVAQTTQPDSKKERRSKKTPAAAPRAAAETQSERAPPESAGKRDFTPEPTKSRSAKMQAD